MRPGRLKCAAARNFLGLFLRGGARGIPGHDRPPRAGVGVGRWFGGFGNRLREQVGVAARGGDRDYGSDTARRFVKTGTGARFACMQG